MPSPVANPINRVKRVRLLEKGQWDLHPQIQNQKSDVLALHHTPSITFIIDSFLCLTRFTHINYTISAGTCPISNLFPAYFLLALSRKARVPISSFASYIEIRRR